ncbi:MAG: endoglucanase [Methanobrevibacter sp.]|nr:endoglucanase [Methanobrevibacter sp.]
MSNDKDKLLQIMASLESDYAHGKISKEKYIYFRSKYEDRLNALDAREATNRIRSMQGKSSDSPKDKEPIKNEKKEDEDLVQKYIINPKKGDKQIEPKVPMDSGTFKLVAILILAIGFTVGAGFGVFNFDFGSFANTNTSAIVTDTAFPDVADVQVNTTTSSNVSSFTNSTSNLQIDTSTNVNPTTSDSGDAQVTPDSGGGSDPGNGTG